MKRIIPLAVATVFLLGWIAGRGCAPRSDRVAAAAGAATPVAGSWTCSMHPQIRQPMPGRCPICAMDLIPVGGTPGAADAGVPALTLSAAARALAEVETAPAERRRVDVVLRMAGRIGLDETRVAYITARVPGRIDRLYANVSGTAVRKGEHLADLYSPELLSTQEELLQAAKAVAAMGPGSRSSAESLLGSAREKLRLWGFTAEQVAEIERDGRVRERLTILSPIEGVVMSKEATEGMYVETGTRLFTVADLSSVWIGLDAYEPDLAWIRFGQEVELHVEAFPGERWQGRVAVVDPVVDSGTRTTRVRVTAANPGGRLKPGMFVRGELKAPVTAAGRVAPPDLRGKWTCSMHPDVLSAGPGTCPLCHMPLVGAGTLVQDEGPVETRAPLTIPASAPLVTGTRAIVYVATPGQDGRFEGREVALGPRAGDFYVVLRGLEEGDRVVTRGAFKLDSSLQIQGMRSMMSGEPSAPVDDRPGALATVTVPDALRPRLRAFFDALASAADALARDDAQAAKQAAASASAAWSAAADTPVPDGARAAWDGARGAIALALGAVAAAPDLAAVRTAFAGLAEPARVIARALGPGTVSPLYVVHCPMAFENRGALWLQKTKDVRNPYFGPAMLTCGEVVESLEPDGAVGGTGTP